MQAWRPRGHVAVFDGDVWWVWRGQRWDWIEGEVCGSWSSPLPFYPELGNHALERLAGSEGRPVMERLADGYLYLFAFAPSYFADPYRAPELGLQVRSCLSELGNVVELDVAGGGTMGQGTGQLPAQNVSSGTNPAATMPVFDWFLVNAPAAMTAASADDPRVLDVSLVPSSGGGQGGYAVAIALSNGDTTAHFTWTDSSGKTVHADLPVTVVGAPVGAPSGGGGQPPPATPAVWVEVQPQGGNFTFTPGQRYAVLASVTNKAELPDVAAKLTSKGFQVTYSWQSGAPSRNQYCVDAWLGQLPADTVNGQRWVYIEANYQGAQPDVEEQAYTAGIWPVLIDVYEIAHVFVATPPGNGVTDAFNCAPGDPNSAGGPSGPSTTSPATGKGAPWVYWVGGSIVGGIVTYVLYKML